MARASQPTLLHRIEYLAARIAGLLLAPLPAGLAANIGAVAGILASRLFPVRRRTLVHNLRIAFGDQLDDSERRRIAREAYKSLAMTAVETMMLQHRGRNWVRQRIVAVENGEVLDELRERHGSFLGVTAHLGNWELLGAYWGATRELSTLAKPLHNPPMQAFVERTRARHGLQIIWTDTPSPARAILRALRDGRIVNVLPDQDMGHEGVFVDFFGRPASTTTAPAFFAIRTGKPIVPGFLVREGPTRHRVVIAKPVDPADFAHIEPMEERVRAVTQAYTRTIEDMVRLYPAQYFWFHRRWKTTPEEVQRKKEKGERRRSRRAAKARRRAEAST